MREPLMKTWISLYLTRRLQHKMSKETYNVNSAISCLLNPAYANPQIKIFVYTKRFNTAKYWNLMNPLNKPAKCYRFNNIQFQRWKFAACIGTKHWIGNQFLVITENNNAISVTGPVNPTRYTVNEVVIWV